MAFDPMSLRSYRMQNIQLEFASLQHVQLRGIYLCLTAGDPTLWTGVLFVRKGPYAPAVFRFSISFPPNYPTSLPVIAFTADIFHPLLAPLTTYTFTGTTEADSITGSREERVPPGAFSFRYGVQEWHRIRSEPPADSDADSPASRDEEQDKSQTSCPECPGIVDLLKFMRSTFEDEEVLDALPFEAAANPSAWYAWRSYRGETGASQASSSQAEALATSDSSSSNGNSKIASSPRPRHPSQWKWDGVWEERVKRSINASLNESVLYGSTGRDENTYMQFVNSPPEEIEGILADMRHSIGLS